MKNNMKPWTIVVHTHPDLDAIAGIWLLKRFGEEKFPGIANAKVAFAKNDREVPTGEDTISLDIGGGRFDHHPQEKCPGDCATSLVAKHLEIYDEPILNTILRFVINNDLKGTSHPLDLADIIKLMNNQYPDKPEQVISWAMEALEAKYNEQLSFFTEAKQEYEQKAKVDDEIKRNGKTLKIVIIESNNENIVKYALSCDAAVIIQKQTSGNVQIHTNKQYGLKLHDVAQVIRLDEQEMEGKKRTTNWKALSSEGTVPGVRKWYYHKGMESLLNGSHTHPGTPQTKIPLENIKEAVKLGISTHLPNEVCRKTGVCVHNLQGCPYYKYGLSRCRKLRKKAQHTS